MEKKIFTPKNRPWFDFNETRGLMSTTRMINLISLESEQQLKEYSRQFLMLLNLQAQMSSTLICGNLDGAFVKFGNTSGVFKRLKDDVPQAISIHYIAHYILHLKPH